MAHVINLAVQEMLGKKGLKAEAPNEVVPYDADDDAQEFVNSGLIQEENVQGDMSDELGDADKNPVNPLIKLRKGIVKIRYMTA